MTCDRNSKDLLLTALVKQGINLILPPRNLSEPGELILVEPGNSIRTASWIEVFGLETKPEIKPDGAFKAFLFDAASTMEAKASAGLLGRVLEGLGVGSGRFKSAFEASKAKTIELTLIAPANWALTNFDAILGQLRRTKAHAAPDYAHRTFCIVVKSWQATGLRLRVLDKANTQVDLTAEAVQDLSATAGLAIKREATGSYAFAADAPPRVWRDPARDRF